MPNDYLCLSAKFLKNLTNYPLGKNMYRFAYSNSERDTELGEVNVVGTHCTVTSIKRILF